MLFTQLIQTNLHTRFIGQSIDYYPRLASTNAEAWEQVGQPKEVTEGTVILTDHQYAGRGRGLRSWVTAADKNLTFSTILFPKLPVNRLPLFSLIAGLAVVEALELESIQATLKWPNDVRLNRKKIGGILNASKISQQNISTLVIGIGVNINMTKQDLTPELRKIATSPAMEIGRTFQRELILANMLNRFEHWYTHLREEETESIIQAWLDRCDHLNSTISFHAGQQLVNGKFLGITSNGSARIQTGGEEREYSTGQILDD